MKFLPLALASALVAATDAYTVGIVGGGVVGGGIAKLLQSRKNALETAAGTTLVLKTVCVRDLKRGRDWVPPPGCTLVDDASAIVGNKDIDLVVEVAGGVTEARDVVMGAIKAGQDVVTANKALIAAHMPEIKEASREQRRPLVGFISAFHVTNKLLHIRTVVEI